MFGQREHVDAGGLLSYGIPASTDEPPTTLTRSHAAPGLQTCRSSSRPNSSSSSTLRPRRRSGWTYQPRFCCAPTRRLSECRGMSPPGPSLRARKVPHSSAAGGRPAGAIPVQGAMTSVPMIRFLLVSGNAWVPVANCPLPTRTTRSVILAKLSLPRPTNQPSTCSSGAHGSPSAG